MKRVAILIAVIAVLALALLGQEEQRYTSDSVARLSFIGGKTYVQRASDLGYEEAVINTPVTEGDRLGTSEGRAEVHLSRGNYLRLDENSKLDILNLPKKGDDIVRLRVWSGSVYVDIGNLVREKTVEIHTADASFYVLEPGLYRVDVTENQGTLIYVFNGLIEAAGEQGSAAVKSEQTLEVTEGRFSGEPERFQATADDAFDRWNETRNSDLNQKVARRYLPQELEEYEGELARYGNWVNLPPYGYVWTPGGIGPDWRPYYDGRWVWLGLTGWTWLPYEPWGWSTFHYGRWHWGVGVGWYWIPTSMWGPAWVNWWWDDYYFGWAPLGWYGYPVAIVDGRFYGRWDRGYYPWNSRAMTVVRRDSLRDPKISSRALRGDDLKPLSQIQLSKRSLDVRPVGNRVSVQPLDGKRVILREGGMSLGRFREGASRAGRGDEGREQSGTVTKSKGRESGDKSAGASDKASPQSLGKGKSGDSGSAPARQFRLLGEPGRLQGPDQEKGRRDGSRHEPAGRRHGSVPVFGGFGWGLRRGASLRPRLPLLAEHHPRPVLAQPGPERHLALEVVPRPLSQLLFGPRIHVPRNLVFAEPVDELCLRLVAFGLHLEGCFEQLLARLVFGGPLLGFAQLGFHGWQRPQKIAGSVGRPARGSKDSIQLPLSFCPPSDFSGRCSSGKPVALAGPTGSDFAAELYGPLDFVVRSRRTTPGGLYPTMLSFKG